MSSESEQVPDPASIRYWRREPSFGVVEFIDTWSENPLEGLTVLTDERITLVVERPSDQAQEAGDGYTD